QPGRSVARDGEQGLPNGPRGRRPGGDPAEHSGDARPDRRVRAGLSPPDRARLRPRPGRNLPRGRRRRRLPAGLRGQPRHHDRRSGARRRGARAAARPRAGGAGMTRQVTIVDSTLRDGSHAKRHQFTAEHARGIAAALDRAGVPAIEVSHGDGLGGSSVNYGFSLVDEYDLLAAAAQVVDQARLTVLLLPGIGVKEDLHRARELGASIVRVATHCTEADIAESHLGYARELGYTAIGFLMMAHMTPPARLAEQARIMAGAGAEVVYVTDSAGALLPDEAEARVAALREALPGDVEVGFHGH